LVLFLLISTPITFFLVNIFFNNKGIRKRVILMPLLIGMLLSIPYFLFYWSFINSFFNNWTPGGVYFFHFLKRNGSASIYITLFIATYFLLSDKKTVSRLREIAAYVAGFIFTLGVYDVLVYESWYGVLELFILPFNRIALFLALSIFLNRFLTSKDWKKYIWIGFAVLLPFFLNFLPYIASYNKGTISLVLSVVLSLVSFFFFILEGRELT